MKPYSNQSPVPTPSSVEFDDHRGDAESQVKSTFERANAEMEAVFQEGMALEEKGKLDAAAQAQIESRLQDISNKLNKELDDQIARVKAQYPLPNRWVLPKSFRLPASALLIFVIVGAVLEMLVGSSFIFSGSNDYRRAVPWLLCIVVPLVAVGFFLLEKRNHQMKAQFPTWSIRWLAMFPLIIAMCSAAIVISPLGWASVLGWVIGMPTERLEAIVISIDNPRSRSGECDQHADLEFRGVTARICVEDLVMGATPKAGERVLISGRLSSLGLYIDTIHRE